MYSFFVWFLSLSIMILRFTQLLYIPRVHSFSLLSSSPLCDGTTIFLSTQLVMNMSGFHFGAVTNKAACVQVFMYRHISPFLLGKDLRVDWLRLMVSVYLTF